MEEKSLKEEEGEEEEEKITDRKMNFKKVVGSSLPHSLLLRFSFYFYFDSSQSFVARMGDTERTHKAHRAPQAGPNSKKAKEAKSSEKQKGNNAKVSSAIVTV